jgi:hypothetical protein
MESLMKKTTSLVTLLLLSLFTLRALAIPMNISTYADVLITEGQTIGTGTGELTGGVLTYELEYVINLPIFGAPTILQVNGFIYDGVPPTGEGVATSCTGVDLVCDPIQLNEWGVETYVSGGPLSETGVTILTTPPSASGNSSSTVWTITPASVPVPATAWLVGSALLGLAGARRRKVFQ